jgi:hypothetical protein
LSKYRGEVGYFTLEKAFHREGRQGREGKQSTRFVIKITNLVIASVFTLILKRGLQLSKIANNPSGAPT